jgi:hypothetical protein
MAPADGNVADAEIVTGEPHNIAHLTITGNF